MAELSGQMNCSDLFRSSEPAITPNTDIAGIGVVISFLLSALLPTVFILVSYVCGVVPIQLLTRGDTDFFKVKFRRRTAWHKTLVKAILLFSDQQIVTGIAIMVAVYSRLSTTSTYHFRIAMFLAWTASNTHLTTLVVLRRYLMTSNVLRVWRVSGMLVLYGMLIFALVPGTMWNWEEFTKGRRSAVFSHGLNQTIYFNPNYPAQCLFQPPSAADMEPETLRIMMDPDVSEALFQKSTRFAFVFNILLVTGLYLLKGALMFERLSYLLVLVCKSYPLWLVERGLKSCAGTAAKYATVRHNTGGSSLSRPAQVKRFARFRYRALVSLYIIMMCFLDFLQTFIANIILLAWGTAWGTIQIYLASFGLGDEDPSENFWGFGQILPMMLLLLPIASVIDSLFGSRDKEIGQGTHHQLLMEEGTYASTTTTATTPTISRANSHSGPAELPTFTEADFSAPPRYQSALSTPQRARSPSTRSLMPPSPNLMPPSPNLMPRSPNLMPRSPSVSPYTPTPDRKIPIIETSDLDWALESPMPSPGPDMNRFPMPPRGRSLAPSQGPSPGSSRGPSPAPQARSTGTSIDVEKRRSLLPTHNNDGFPSFKQTQQPAPHQFLGGPRPPDMYMPLSEWFRTLETPRPRLRDATAARYADDARTLALHRFLYRTRWCKAVFFINTAAMIASILGLVLFGLLDQQNPLSIWRSTLTILEIWLGLCFAWWIGGFFVKHDLYK